MKNLLLIFKEKNINLKNTISILLILGIFSGIFGFIYEILFYKIDLGYFVKRGSSFGPWIPIYFFGGILIAIFSYRIKEKPILVFLVNSLVTGILEYGTGFVLYEVFNKRLWDYNTEIWNFGNINGYICLRSVLFFGISSLFLIYAVIPMILKLFDKIKERKFRILSIVLTAIFVADCITYMILN